ncbi:MAG: bifunctional oligoribonuclease/PAP phosphatase NrnA [Rikenellaceae bacterium]|nr:bifunctional oligoribonuclease/PAP phosphatase NrnA [Rikenellaceae bacterium]
METKNTGALQLDPEELKRLRALLEREPQQIVLLAHTNPDGDAIGSALAWARQLERLGHSVRIIAPNRFPYFLESMPGISEVIIHRQEPERSEQLAREADVIFCIDFNGIARLEALGQAIESNASAVRVLIDHHLQPTERYDIRFSHPESCSTAFLVYSLILEIFGREHLTREIAECLYVGMMTDTGNFSYSVLTPALFRAVADLAETGIDIPAIYNGIYNAYSPQRARLFGYVIHRNMKFLKHNTVAYMSLTEEEMRRYYFQQGDSEGFVNYPLTVGKMKLSAMFLQHHTFIRVSLRSRGNVDVNLFARRYFEGGGHKNAAGGKSYVSMEETIEHFKRSIEEFASEGGLKQ